MKNKLFPIYSACISGIGIGIPITLCCMTIIGGFNGVIREFLVWTVASALFGVLSLLLFQLPNSLSLPVATALHCIGCMVTAAGAAAIVGYADSFLELLLGILPVFLIVYTVLYGSFYIIMKKEAQRINQELNSKS